MPDPISDRVYERAIQLWQQAQLAEWRAEIDLWDAHQQAIALVKDDDRGEVSS